MRTMRKYIAVCGLPLKKIGDKQVPRLILGHLPFVGESYQGLEKNRECAARFSDIKNTVKILRLAIEKYGLTVYAAGVSADNGLTGLFLKAVKETERLTNTELAIIPCIQIPLTINRRPVDAYRRWLTYYEIERQTAGDTILNKYLEDSVLQCRRDWKTKFKKTLHHSKPYSERELKELQVNFDSLEKQFAVLEDHKILFTELGSETDFLTMTNRLDLLETLVKSLRNTYGHDVLLGVHHPGTTIPKLENSEIKFDAYVTPTNRMGVMMFPTREMAVKVIRAAKKPVIAIKPLAGGRIKPKEALEYIYNEMGIDFCMVGVGSLREAEEDFSAAHEILKKYIN
jgi:hypothetical protein